MDWDQMNSGRILISGATGLLGSALASSAAMRERTISRLVRRRSGQAPGAAETIDWNPAQPLAPEKVSGFDVVIHLAGENIFGLWTKAKKRRIIESRVAGTRHLAEAIAQAAAKPRVFLCASAVGYYGSRGDEVLTESAASGEGFLADCCRQWESASLPAQDAGVRTVHLRTGLVLSSKGGALQKMLPAFRMGLGGKLGSGKQWLSWIHIVDWAGAVEHILANESLHGPVNMVAPNPVTNADFTKTLAGALARPSFFGIPTLVLRAMGEAAEELLLASQRADPEKLRQSGHAFRFSNLPAALRDLLST